VPRTSHADSGQGSRTGFYSLAAETVNHERYLNDGGPWYQGVSSFLGRPRLARLVPRGCV